MSTRTIRILGAMIMALAVLGGLPGPAQAVDGVVLIDQNRALAGNVTPGDTPGFPVTISRSGSYRLSGNLTVPNEDTDAIRIAASNVTLDLNGFSILGPTVCSGSPTTCTASGGGSGVIDETDGSFDGTAVVNGTVQGMGLAGILLFGNARIENVHAVSNGAFGILLISGKVASSTALRNGLNGIGANRGTVSGCTALDNGQHGINGGAITVTGNTASGNRTGIAVDRGSVVIGNVSTSNSFGLFLDSESGYTHNVLSGNSTAVLGGTSLGQNLCDGVIC